jgi:hypothetical protein
MAKSILEYYNYLKKYIIEIVAISTVMVGILTGNIIKEWLLKEQNIRIKKIEREVSITKKVACGMLEIEIMQAKMMSILAIQGQEDIEVEKARQNHILDITIESLKKTRDLCNSND